MSHRTEGSSSHHSSRDSHGSKNKKSKKESNDFFGNIASAVAPLVFGPDKASKEWHKGKSRDRFHAENRHPERLPMFKYLSKHDQRAILQQSNDYHSRSSSSRDQSKSGSYSRSSSRDDASSSGYHGSVLSHHTRATSSSRHHSSRHRPNANHQAPVSGYHSRNDSDNNSDPEGRSSSATHREPGENYHSSEPSYPSTAPPVVDSSTSGLRNENVRPEPITTYTVNRDPEHLVHEIILGNPTTPNKVPSDNYNSPGYAYRQFRGDHVQEQASSKDGTNHSSRSRGPVSQYKKKRHSSPLQSVKESSSLHTSVRHPRCHHSSRSHRRHESSSHRSTDQIHVKSSKSATHRQGTNKPNSHSSRHRSERYGKLSQKQHDNSDGAGGYYENDSLMACWFDGMHPASDERSHKPAESGAGVGSGARDSVGPSEIERTLSDYWGNYHSGQDSPQAIFGDAPLTDEGNDDNPDEWTSVVYSEHLNAQSEIGIDSRPLRPADSISNVMVGMHARERSLPQSLRRRAHESRKK